MNKEDIQYNIQKENNDPVSFLHRLHTQREVNIPYGWFHKSKLIPYKRITLLLWIKKKLKDAELTKYLKDKSNTLENRIM